MITKSGSAIELEKMPGKLRLTLTADGRECLLEHRVVGDDKYNWDKGTDELLHELLEYHLCNGWEFIRPEEIGALTSAPIISDTAERDEHGDLLVIGAVYWFPQYETTSELEEMMEKGFVDFTKAD